MDFNKSNLSLDAQKLQHGLAMANRRLLEWDAALGRTLVFGRLDGTFEEINAQEFLEEVKTSEWWKFHFEEQNKEKP